MARKVRSATFVAQLKEQLAALRGDEHGYRAMQLYAAGVPEPWEFTAEDDFEFYEETGVLVVRDGPTDENGHDNAQVPEYVFRLEAIVASQLV
jgi:hypothetical protein